MAEYVKNTISGFVSEIPLIMAFLQTVVATASWVEDELIRFWGQRSKVKVTASGGRHTELNARHRVLTVSK